MNKVIGDVLVGALNGTTANGTNLVPGQAGNGIYFGDEASRVDYGTHQSNCFYDPDICSQGVNDKRCNGNQHLDLQPYTHYHQHLCYNYICYHYRS